MAPSHSSQPVHDALLQRIDRAWFSPPVRAVRSALRGAYDLMTPTWCLGCHAAADMLCPECAQDLRLHTRHPFRAEEAAESLPILDHLSVLPVVSAARYISPVAEVMLAFKDRERVSLARPLAVALTRSLEVAVAIARHAAPGRELLLVYPPPTMRSQLRRGRHPLGELLQLSELPPGVIDATGLVRHRMKPTDFMPAALVPGAHGQKSRSQQRRRRRQADVVFALEAASVLPGADVVLVDDVLTTGSTLGSLYDVLTAAGARVHAGAVVAAVPRPS